MRTSQEVCPFFSPWCFSRHSVCLSVCLSAFLSVCLSAFLSVCLSVCQSTCVSHTMGIEASMLEGIQQHFERARFRGYFFFTNRFERSYTFVMNCAKVLLDSFHRNCMCTNTLTNLSPIQLFVILLFPISFVRSQQTARRSQRLHTTTHSRSGRKSNPTFLLLCLLLLVEGL